MSRHKLNALLSEIRQRREQTLAELADLGETELDYETDRQRWSDVRRLLLRFGDHMREHTTQIAGLRVALGHEPTMPQRILMEAELAWGKLLASTVGLNDDELLKTPSDGGWSLQQILEHMLDSEEGYLVTIRDARIKRRAHREQE